MGDEVAGDFPGKQRRGIQVAELLDFL